MLIFDIDGVRYAVELASVREIVRAVAVTALPGSPAVVAGVINLRGSAIPVFDLRLRFGAEPRELHPDERFVVARTSRRTVALRVDAVEWIREIAEADVKAASDLASTSRYVTGVARLPDGVLLIHDVEGFLSAAEADALEASLAATGPESAG